MVQLHKALENVLQKLGTSGCCCGCQEVITRTIKTLKYIFKKKRATSVNLFTTIFVCFFSKYEAVSGQSDIQIDFFSV